MFLPLPSSTHFKAYCRLGSCSSRAQALIILPDEPDNIISANFCVWHGFVYDTLQSLFCQLRNRILDAFLSQQLLKLSDERICDVTQVACVASGNQRHVIIISEVCPPRKQTYAVPNKLRKPGELCLAISILMMYNIIYDIKTKP